jgi:hypothetical protein
MRARSLVAESRADSPWRPIAILLGTDIQKLKMNRLWFAITGHRPASGMRQEVDIRYVVTSLKGTAQHLYEDVYCQRGQMKT